MASTTSTTSSTSTASKSGIGNWSDTVAVSEGLFKFGLPDDFTKTVYLPPSTVNNLKLAEVAFGLDARDKTWDLYKEQKLTDLRGQVSKELAQLNHVTETTKAKIAAKSALDVGRLEADSSFRNGLRTSLAASMQGFWS